MMIIDFHTHAFPDKLAERAMGQLTGGMPDKASHNGTVTGLLASMDRAGIEKSLVYNIATKEEQFPAIIEWSKEIRSDRIIPLPSIFPVSSKRKMKEQVKIVKGEGFQGIKLHPYYQNFIMDELKAFCLYELLAEYELFLASHCGFDSAYPRERVADAQKILHVMAEIPELTFITTHFGGWDDWDVVEKELVGKNIYIEISFVMEMAGVDKAKEMILSHPSDCLLFGTDSPWTDQLTNVELLRSLDLGEELENKIFSQNALRILQTV